MRLPAIESVILFGGAPLLVGVARWCVARAMPVRVYTAPRHANETVADEQTLTEVLAELGVATVVTEDINAEDALIDQIDGHTLGLGIGEAWSFDSRIITAFAGRLVDFMGIPHPRYRGGAHYTWMIMRGDRSMGMHIQVINEDMVQGEHDSGHVLISDSYQLPETARTPQDYFDAAVPHEVDFLARFIADCAAGVEFLPRLPDESCSMFLPRQRTDLHGWIDWSWSGLDIERFICAFDAPYPGARTCIGDDTVCLQGARLLDDEPPFHPYQSGLITRVQSDGVVLATTAGHLLVARITDQSGQDLAVAVGQRLTTSPEQLHAARCATVHYGT